MLQPNSIKTLLKMRKMDPNSSPDANSKQELDEATKSRLLLQETDEYLEKHMQWKKLHEKQNKELQDTLNKPIPTHTTPNQKYVESKQSVELHKQVDTLLTDYENEKLNRKKPASNQESIKISESKAPQVSIDSLKKEIEIGKFMNDNSISIQQKAKEMDDMMKDLNAFQDDLNIRSEALDDIMGKLDNYEIDKSQVASNIRKEYEDINKLLKK